MKRTSFADTLCPMARTLDFVGEWWTLLILRDVFYGIHRFDKLLSNLGIARNVLTNRLRTLVENGILEKRLYQDKPARYEYYLTESGRELLPVLSVLISWGNRRLKPQTDAAIELVHETCGHAVVPVLQCNHCHKEVSTNELSPNDLGDKLQLWRSTSKS